jgi:putative aldouronate transport system substrate-binding protein
MSSYGRSIRCLAIACLSATVLLSCVRVRPSTDYRDFKIGENIELRYWAPAWAWFSGMNQAGEYPMYQKLEELTGVRVTFEHPSYAASAQEQLALLQNADYLPDIIEWNWFEYYPGGPEQAILDGMIVRLDEFLPRHAPNMLRLITENEEVTRWISTNDGSFYAFPHLTFSPSWRLISAPVFKEDWLEAVGKSVPETLEQWHDVLTSFRDHDFKSFGDGQEYPFLLFAYESLTDSTLAIPNLNESSIFANAFGVAHGFYSAEGTFRYGPIQPEYREMLEMLADWYAQGLFHPILTSPPFSGSPVVDLLIKSGGWIGDDWEGGFVSSFRLVEALPLTRDGTAPTVHMLSPIYRGWRSAAVSAESTLKVEAVRWLDLAYSEAGSVIFNFGLEGESYTTDGGRPVLTDEIRDDIRRSYESGRYWASDLRKFARGIAGGPYVLSEELARQFWTAIGVNSGEWPAAIWDQAQTMPEAVLPFFPAERVLYESIMDEVGQYHLRNFIAFITGTRPLIEFADYVMDIQRMGIHEAEEILTEAWRKFYAKPVR